MLRTDDFMYKDVREGGMCKWEKGEAYHTVVPGSGWWGLKTDPCVIEALPI